MTANSGAVVKPREFVFDELIDLLGISTAYRIASGWGGGTLYIPKQLNWDHPIALAIGHEEAITLCGTYGGVYLEIPPKARALRTRREQLICDDLKEGATIGQASRKYGLTQTAVRNICQRNKIKRPPQ